MDGAERVCVYCGREVLTGSERPEHPVPQAMGSRLATRAVCDPCNEWAGREIDQPCLDEDWIKHFQFEHKLRDQRGRRAARSSPMLSGQTADGVWVVMNDEGEPEIKGGRIIEGPDDTVQIIAGNQAEADRLLKIVEQRAKDAGKTAEIGEWRSGQIHPEVKNRVSVGFVRWARMAAKIGLGVGSLVYPPEWRTSEDAQRLRRQLRDPHPKSADGAPMGVAPGIARTESPFDKLARPPEHLLLFLNADGNTLLWVVIFGQVLFCERVRSDGESAPDRAWLIDPVDRGRVTTTTLMEVAVQRLG